MKENDNYSDEDSSDNEVKNKEDNLGLSINEKPDKLLINDNIPLKKDSKNIIKTDNIKEKKDNNIKEKKENNNLDIKDSNNLEIKNNNILEIKDNNNLEINNRNVIENEIEKEDENLDYIKFNENQNLVCPDCGEIPNLQINHTNFIIKSICLNKHIIEDSLVNFIKRSNEKFSEDFVCSKCQKKMSEFNNKRNDMYKCKCGKIICKDCKDTHEELNEGKNEENQENEDEDDDEKKHNLVNFSEKDFKCTCTDELDDYYYFCKKCNKNLCGTCEVEHSNHPIYDFSKEIDNNLPDKDDIEKKFEEQKKIINDFLKKVYKLKKKLEERIELLDKTLQSYLEINNYIIKKFDRNALNYQTIENIKNLNLNLPELFDIFRNSTQEKDSFTILVSLFDYQIKKNQNFIMKEDYKAVRNLSSVNISKITEKPLKDKLDDTITSICQLKNGLAVGDCKGQIHIYALTKKALNKKYSIPDNKGNDIKFLYTLKNGYLISSIYNQFQIYELSDKGIGYKKIQSFNYTHFPDANENNIIIQDLISRTTKTNKTNKSKKNNKNNNIENIENIIKKYHYQILELINNHLIYIDGSKLIILNPSYENNYQENPLKTIELNSNIICMTELNSNKFSVYCENNNLIVFDSNTFKEKKIIKNLSKIETIRKIAGVNNDIIAALGELHLYLISEAKEEIIDEKILKENNFYDICTQPNSIIALSTKFLLFQYDIKLNSEGKYINNIREKDIKFKEIKKYVNSIYLLNYENNNNENINGNIVYVYDDINIKVL